MNRFTQLTVAGVVLALLATPAFADTLFLKTGARVNGYFEGGTARVVKFRGPDGTTKDYDILMVQEISFGDATSTASSSSTSSSTSNATSNSAAAPQLRPANERPPANPASSSAATTAYTIPTGSPVTIHTVDAINSETSKAGTTFVAVLDQALIWNGVEVAPKGSDVRGRITNVNEAGRVAGAAQLGLELTQIYVNGIPYALSTSEYSEVGENRAGQTVKRAGVGAGVGAVIGAIAGGGKGAAIGAGVGAGAGTAAQVLTKGEKLNIPPETRLEFTLRAPLVIAAR